ncbi:MAG: AbrB/MazE/SpoVT family DNA-binding domain-containing protein [Thermomicrobiales bacterium]
MATTVTTKGQVTIPKEVRDELGLRPGDRVEIVTDGTGSARLSKAKGLTLEEAFTYLKMPFVSDEEIEHAAEEGWVEGSTYFERSAMPVA